MAHLDQDLSLTNIAALLGSSVTRLIAAFKGRTGTTPHQFIFGSRVDKATGFLVATELPMAEVALRCGFYDQQHMVNVLQRLTGPTPGAIRRRP